MASDKQLDAILEVFDHLMYTKPELVDPLIECWWAESCDMDVGLAILSATNPMKSKLRARKYFFDEFKSRLGVDGEDVEGLLQGLE